jgi:hypothetical protein
MEAGGGATAICLALAALRRANGPQIAKVHPGLWMFTKNVSPPGEKTGPANSESLRRLLANT